ncbi:MAG: hypothetical protein ACTSU5_20835 [Promethearchaeota archaeon]
MAVGEVDEARKICPKCGSKKILEVDDKSKVLMYQVGTPIYAKKFKCGECGTEFR